MIFFNEWEPCETLIKGLKLKLYYEWLGQARHQL